MPRSRQPLRATAASRHDPQARELVAQPRAVEAPVQVLDAARRRLLLIADAKPLFAALGEDCDALPVRRPIGGARLARELGQRPRLAAPERQEPRLRLARAAGHEDERLPVGREPWPRVAVARRDLLRPAAAHGHAPEPRLVRAVLDRASTVDRRRAVGCDSEMSQKRLAKNVLRNEPPQCHSAIMDSVRIPRYSAGRPEPL